MRNLIYPELRANLLPGNSMNCYGIDLGTTYTLMATIEGADVDFKASSRLPVKFIRIPQLSPIEYDPEIMDEKVASILAFYNGKPYVGNNLYHLKGRSGFEYKKNMFYHWKIEMGVDHHPMYPDAVSEKLNMPYKIAGQILNYCRAVHLQDKELELKNAIITVPASFQANQRNDTLKAVETAKIEANEQMLIDEPNAAFLGFFNRLTDSERQKWAANIRNKNVLIIDFGGGTCDLSILNVDFTIEKGISIGNKAISRYNDLGGQDIDMLLAEEFLYPKFLEVWGKDSDPLLEDIQNMILPQLAVIAEKLKIGICDKLNLRAGDKSVEDLDFEEITFTTDDTTVSYENVEYFLDKITINGKVFKEYFTKIFRGRNYEFKFQDKLLTTVSHSISEILEKSDMTLDNIDFVLYVGGSSYNPFLISMVSEKLQNSKPLTSPEPDKLVAEGAAVYSYFYYAGGVSLINPITSDTIGIRLKGDTFYPLIEKGTSLPVSVEFPDFKLQSTMQDELLVPVCVNGIDFTIGDISCPLKGFYTTDSVVKIKAEISRDKTFEVKVYIDDEFVGEGDFDNPFAVGMVSEEEREIQILQRKINNAKFKGNRAEEKSTLRSLIWKHSDVGNNLGALQCAEEYIKRFDDQDASVWNMIYCKNSNMGRAKAAKKALNRAIELNPDEPTFIYNYSLIIENESEEEALNYLEKQNASVQRDESIRCKKVLLKKKCNIDCSDEVQEIIELYKKRPYAFSDFDKRVLLPSVFRINDEPYSYVNPKSNNNKNYESKFLTRTDKPSKTK